MTEITDEKGLEVMQAKTVKPDRIATVFVPRTIIYPVEITRNKTTEIEPRTFVRMYEYTSERRWQKALEIEKKYKKMNDAYRASLKAAGKPVEAKEKANPMNFTPLGRD